MLSYIFRALHIHEQKHKAAERRAMNEKIDAEINALCRAEFGWGEDDGFIDWFGLDVSQGFHVYADDELEYELKHKASLCYPDPPEILTMFFYQSTSAKNIEVDYNTPYHEKLVRELENLPETGAARTNALSRIRYAAKKIGLRTQKGSDGRNYLATDIRVVWRDQNGFICG